MPFVRYSFTFFSLLFATSLHAQEVNPCHSDAIKAMKPTSCWANHYDYQQQGNKKGWLIDVQLPGIGQQFFLQTDKKERIDLGGFPQRHTTNMMKCVMNELDIDASKAGSYVHYKTGHLGRYSMQLDGDKLYAVLSGHYPFTGELRVTNDAACHGSFGYDDNAYTWQEGSQQCKDAFVRDAGKEVEPEMLVNRIYDHVAGYYYLCSVRDRKADPETRDHYFYRVDLEKDGKPGTVLMRKATPTQLKRWGRS